MQIGKVRTSLVATAALVLAGAFSFAVADQIVYFTNGKAIMVKTVEQEDGITFLGLEGGGRLGVPSDQILRIEEHAVSKPNGARPPAAPPTRAAARPTAPAPDPTGPDVSGIEAARAAAVDQETNLVADAPSVVPDGIGDAAAALAAPRESAQGTDAAPQESGVVAAPLRSQEAQLSGAAASAATLAAQQSMAAKLDQRERAGRLNSPRGRAGSRGSLRGQALMGGQSPRRPGQGVVRDGAAPAGSESVEEIVPSVAERRGEKQGDATGKTSPPPEDGKAEQPPSEAN